MNIHSKQFRLQIVYVLFIWGFSVLTLNHPATAQTFVAEHNLTVLDQPADQMMDAYLTAIVEKQFAERNLNFKRLKTASDWEAWAQTVTDSMRSWTGEFPERTPLNARITGRIERNDYIIEKVLFESRPGFFVTANLYLPKNYSGKRPAILNPIGHSPNGKARDKVQMRCIGQVKKGFAALAFDCIGQGERRIKEYEYFSGPPSNAHKILGLQAFLAGTHLLNYMVWDAIRAVDYLVSRSEVDPGRIGCTGSSGGGMMTTYLLPFEPRITAAAPAANPNTWSFRVHADLATDHEQVFFDCFSSGIDPRGDPFISFVPKPLLLNTITDDPLNPARGVWALHTQLFRAYASHQSPEKLHTTMVHAEHAYNRDQREITYAWFLRWLKGETADFHEGDYPIESEETLWVTPHGNVSDLETNQHPHQFIIEYLNTHHSTRQPIHSRERMDQSTAQLQAAIQHVLRPHIRMPQIQFIEQTTDTDIHISKYILTPETGIVLPAVLMETPHDPQNRQTLLYLHDNGKYAMQHDSEFFRELLRSGMRIVAVDLRGTGETAPGMEDKFWDFLAGTPLFGQRVSDIGSCIKWLKRPEVNSGKLTIWGKGMSALYAVHAAVLEGGVDKLVLEEPLVSFEEAVRNRLPQYKNELLLPGVLQFYDLADIYHALDSLPVTIINPVMADQKIASPDVIRKSFISRLAQETMLSWYTAVSGEERCNILRDHIP